MSGLHVNMLVGGGGVGVNWLASDVDVDVDILYVADGCQKMWDKELLLDRMIGRADIPLTEMIKNKGHHSTPCRTIPYHPIPSVTRH